jgi:hypothetical protein
MNLKRTLACALGGAALLGATIPAMAAVSVSIGEPGFFGRINIGGGEPPPQVYNPAPVIVEQGPRPYPGSPIYLRVPVEQQRDWRHWCRNYGACGQPVYFVHEDWYRNVYSPRFHHGPPPPGYWDGDHHHDHGHDHWDRDHDYDRRYYDNR